MMIILHIMYAMMMMMMMMYRDHVPRLLSCFHLNYTFVERGEVVEVKVVKIVPETRTIRLELR
jgi:hypothetical protein